MAEQTDSSELTGQNLHMMNMRNATCVGQTLASEIIVGAGQARELKHLAEITSIFQVSVDFPILS